LEDKAGHVSTRFKKRPNPPGSKRKAGLSVKPKKKKEARKIRKGTHPGSFFGFGPDNGNESMEIPQKAPAKKRKRKKKSVQKKENASLSSTKPDL